MVPVANVMSPDFFDSCLLSGPTARVNATWASWHLGSGSQTFSGLFPMWPKGVFLDSTAEVLRLPLHGSRREAEFDPLGLGWQASCHAPDMPILGTSVFGGVTFQKAVPLSYWDASH